MKKIIKLVIIKFFTCFTQNPIITNVQFEKELQEQSNDIQLNKNTIYKKTKYPYNKSISLKKRNINPPIIIRNSPINRENSLIHITNTPIYIDNTPVDISNSSINISNSSINISNSSINISNTSINNKQFPPLNTYNSTINDNYDDSIILPIDKNPTEFINGSKMAAMQNVISYITKEKIEQWQLGKEIGYWPINTKINSSSIQNVLNKYVSNILNNKRYSYYFLPKRFGETNEEQEWFYNKIHNSLENNCPVIINFQGYLEENYGHNITENTLIINGIKEGNNIKDCTYYILDTNFIKNNYSEIKGKNLPELFYNFGEIITIEPKEYYIYYQ